ncbi:23 kDa integral membrane protein-like [Thrips palmi]|uniref:Tetraspanin n=1 Tax=Thrips palmi TaxID=161013 RepID=A0A6P8Z3E4_THRPL|nr:23 kDa integral membrane protein-like [Thrips palmi]
MPTETGLNCHNGTIKYLLFVANFAIALCGLVGMALAASLLATDARNVGDLGWTLGVISTIGFLTFFIASLGCLGAIRENSRILIAYAACLLAVIVSQIIACGVLIAYSDFADQTIDRMFLHAKMGDPLFGYTVASIQSKFHCCGYNSPSFWYRSNGSDLLPTSCCDGVLLDKCTRDDARLFNVGCRSAFVDFVKKYGIAFGTVGLAIALLQTLGIWFSLALAARIRDLERRMKGL